MADSKAAAECYAMMDCFEATAIRSGYTLDGLLHVELLDESGAVVARASMGAPLMAQHIDACTEALAEVSRRGEIMKPHQGTA